MPTAPKSLASHAWALARMSAVHWCLKGVRETENTKPERDDFPKLIVAEPFPQMKPFMKDEFTDTS